MSEDKQKGEVQRREETRDSRVESVGCAEQSSQCTGGEIATSCRSTGIGGASVCVPTKEAETLGRGGAARPRSRETEQTKKSSFLFSLLKILLLREVSTISKTIHLNECKKWGCVGHKRGKRRASPSRPPHQLPLAVLFVLAFFRRAFGKERRGHTKKRYTKEGVGVGDGMYKECFCVRAAALFLVLFTPPPPPALSPRSGWPPSS